MDLCGPMPIKSRGGKSYAFVIDDYSIFTWVYFIREKSDTLNKFIEIESCNIISNSILTNLR